MPKKNTEQLFFQQQTLSKHFQNTEIWSIDTNKYENWLKSTNIGTNVSASINDYTLKKYDI